MKKTAQWVHILIAEGMMLGLILLSISGCSLPASFSATSTPLPTQTPIATPTLEPKPLGDPQNPIILGAAVSTDNEALSQLASLLAQKTGYAVSAKSYPGLSGLISEMQAGVVQVAWLPPLPYVYAHGQGFANILVISNHFGVFNYGAQFLANADSGFTAYFNAVNGVNTAEAGTALQQLAGKKPCWVNPTSPSGYAVPAGLLQKLNIPVQSGAFLQDHSSVIRALYVKNICDFGVTFAISGDPRTSTAVADLPDTLTRIPILYRTEPVIPNDGIAVLPEIPEDMRLKLMVAFLELIRTPEGRALVSAAFNYDVQDFMAVDHQVYLPLEDLVNNGVLNLEDTISP